MEVDDEEEGGIFDGVDALVVISMEMKEEEDEGRSWNSCSDGGCCGGDEEELEVLVLVKRSEKRK